MWFVSRQLYWGVEPEDQNCVEIAAGGIDYANPDMLVAKFSGEGEEYTDPREAVEAAIQIRDAWKAASPSLVINIAHGATGGATMPFEGDTDAALKAWAEKQYKNLPKCSHCGDVLGKETYTTLDDPDDKFYTTLCRGFRKPDTDRWVRDVKKFKRLFNVNDKSWFPISDEEMGKILTSLE